MLCLLLTKCIVAHAGLHDAHLSVITVVMTPRHLCTNTREGMLVCVQTRLKELGES